MKPPAEQARLHLQSRSSLRRGAWVETVAVQPDSASISVAPLLGGERGLKQHRPRYLLPMTSVAPLLGGERGLKPRPIPGCKHIAEVAPLLGGERGLKLHLNQFNAPGAGVAPLLGGERGLKLVNVTNGTP